MQKERRQQDPLSWMQIIDRLRVSAPWQLQVRQFQTNMQKMPNTLLQTWNESQNQTSNEFFRPVDDFLPPYYGLTPPSGKIDVRQYQLQNTNTILKHLQFTKRSGTCFIYVNINATIKAGEVAYSYYFEYQFIKNKLYPLPLENQFTILY